MPNLKAFLVEDVSCPDAGQEIVFAQTPNKAKMKSNLYQYCDDYTNLRARRYPDADGYESKPDVELQLLLWRNGYTYYDIHPSDQPNPDTASDDDFRTFYKDFFE